MPSYDNYERVRLVMWYMHHTPRTKRHSIDSIARELEIPVASTHKTFQSFPYVFKTSELTGGKELSGKYPGDEEFDLDDVEPWARWIVLKEQQPTKTPQPTNTTGNDDTTKRTKAEYFDRGYGRLLGGITERESKELEDLFNSRDNKDEDWNTRWMHAYEMYQAGTIYLKAIKHKYMDEGFRGLIAKPENSKVVLILEEGAKHG